MATLESKILDGPTHNYCSSSEDELSDSSDSEVKTNKISGGASAPEPINSTKWEGTSTNTGPKGVLADYEMFKTMDQQLHDEELQASKDYLQKHGITVQDALSEEREKLFRSLYKAKLQQNKPVKVFGAMIKITEREQFLQSIDDEDKNVTVIVAILDSDKASDTMQHCVKQLAQAYKNVKFCSAKAYHVGMSERFRKGGVPALLVYKGGEMIGNFIKLADEFGHDFLVEDVQTYLIEHGCLEDINYSFNDSGDENSENDDSD